VKKLQLKAFTLAMIGAAALYPTSLSAEWGDGPEPGFLKFRRGHSIAKNSENVTVRVGMIVPDSEPAGGGNVWFLGTMQGSSWTSITRFRWADGASCPAALDLLKDVRDVELPRPVLPLKDGEDDSLEILVDGRSYSLDVASSSAGGQASGRMHMESNVDTELAKWVDRMLLALAPCWPNRVPEGADRWAGQSDLAPR
jgi:hypothetical protein